MRVLVSLHRILSTTNTRHNDINRIDNIHTEYRDSRRDFPSGNNRKRGDKKGKCEGPSVAHNHFSLYISSSKEKSHRNEDHENRQKKARVFLSRKGSVRHIELCRENRENNK